MHRCPQQSKINLSVEASVSISQAAGPLRQQPRTSHPSTTIPFWYPELLSSIFLPVFVLRPIERASSEEV